ncbi:LysR family transcriptional regulator [Taklimakanibacter lacteus]|uniref:LysR family transcriptional regulator n=1 Tax=Taklimakanibacter lacteus TaxID=2268456 RepID=UPI000E66B7ED
MPGPQSLLPIAYRYFAAVAEAGSVRGAAQMLNVAASAISRQIILLEKQFDLPLFERHGRGLTLSATGEVLLGGLKSAVQVHEATLDHLDALRGLKRGRIRIATVESISVSALPDLLSRFAADYPGIEIAVTVAGSDAVTDLVRSHDADLGFTFNPATLEGLDVRLTKEMPLGAIMRRDHPLARERRLLFSHCLAYPVAWPARGLSLRGILDKLQAAARIEPPHAFECNSLRLMAALARRGRCIAFQTRIGIEQEIADGSLVFVPLANRRIPPDRLTIVHRRGSAAGLAAGAFLDRAVKHFQAKENVRK